MPSLRRAIVIRRHEDDGFEIAHHDCLGALELDPAGIRKVMSDEGTPDGGSVIGVSQLGTFFLQATRELPFHWAMKHCGLKPYRICHTILVYS